MNLWGHCVDKHLSVAFHLFLILNHGIDKRLCYCTDGVLKRHSDIVWNCFIYFLTSFNITTRCGTTNSNGLLAGLVLASRDIELHGLHRQRRLACRQHGSERVLLQGRLLWGRDVELHGLPCPLRLACRQRRLPVRRRLLWGRDVEL